MSHPDFTDFSGPQEEVLTEAVREVRPVLAAALQPGRRVCAYWSQQMSFLHPGSVTGPDTTDPDYVVIQLDDGDSRDIHIGQVRYLPEQYPHVGEYVYRDDKRAMQWVMR